MVSYLKIEKCTTALKGVRSITISLLDNVCDSKQLTVQLIENHMQRLIDTFY